MINARNFDVAHTHTGCKFNREIIGLKIGFINNGNER